MRNDRLKCGQCSRKKRVGNRMIQEMIKTIAEGAQCSRCGQRLSLTMTLRVAQKHGVTNSPYITIPDRSIDEPQPSAT